jgi:hypothetical protein
MNSNSARLVVFVSIFWATRGFAETAADTFDYPPKISLEEVSQWVETADAGHPRLLATAEQLASLRESAERDPLLRLAASAVIKQAVALRDRPPIERKLQGRRLLGESRRCVQRVLTLATAYHLSGDAQHVDRCRQEMLAAARFQDWNPSHFLDVAEMTFALAIGYDWLYEQLDAESRSEIRAAILNKGVRLPFETRHKGWVRSRNNWGQVCHGGLTAGALAVMEDEPELAARTVHNALVNVTHAMSAYAPHGSYPEGPGYWSYGTSYNVLLIAVLDSVFGTDFGLSQAPGFDVTGQYPALATGPSDLFFNYADGGAGRGPIVVLSWFASRYERPDWLLGEEARWRGRLNEIVRTNGRSSASRLLPLVLLWMDEPDKASTPRMPLHWCSEGETPISIHRSSWSDPATTYLGLKAGSPSANHGQMDIGSFVLDADGVRWAIDLGAEGYHGIESRGMNLWSRAQDSDRWTIFRQSNHGHNTLVIDDQLQRAGGMGEFVSFSAAADFPHSVIDMTSVYAGQAGEVLRGAALLPSREVLVQDQLKGLKPGSRVRWGMITRGEPETADGPAVVLHDDSASLSMKILSPSNVTWQVIDTARPRNEWDSPNRGTRMVAFEATAPASGELTLAVLARPGSCRDSAKTRLKLRPLESWE